MRRAVHLILLVYLLPSILIVAAVGVAGCLAAALARAVTPGAIARGHRLGGPHRRVGSSAASRVES